MAAIILPQRWRRQPDGPVTIDTGHNLASGLAWCRSFGFGPLTRWGDSPFLAPGNPGVTISGSVSLATGQSGRAAQFAGASGDYLTYDEYVGSGTKPIGSKIQSTGEMSVFVIARRNGAGNGEEGIIGPASGARWRLTANSAGNKKLRWLILGSAVNVYATTAIVDGQDFTGGGTVTPSRVAIYFNGVNEASTGGDTINPSGQTFNLGDGQGNFNGLIYFAAFWWRALGDHEMKALHDAPYAMFRPLRRRLYFAPAAGAAAITGDAALVEANDVLTSAATVAITGTAALQEANDALSAFSGVTVTGTATIQESDDLLTAQGGTASFATATLQEQNDVLDSAVAVLVTGTAALVEGNDALSAAASVSITATLSAQEQNDVLSAEGGSASFAVTTLLEHDDVLAATGTVLVTGAAAIQEANDALESAVSVSLTAAAALVEANDTLAASGTVGTVVRTADAALVEAPDTSTGAATVSVTGAAAIVEAGDILVSGVTLLVTATAVLVEENDRLTATGAALDTITATAALQEANDTLSATVVRRIARRIAASDSLARGIAASDSARSISATDGLN